MPAAVEEVMAARIATAGVSTSVRLHMYHLNSGRQAESSSKSLMLDSSMSPLSDIPMTGAGIPSD